VAHRVHMGTALDDILRRHLHPPVHR
jgi:hypothetical protein